MFDRWSVRDYSLSPFIHQLITFVNYLFLYLFVSWLPQFMLCTSSMSILGLSVAYDIFAMHIAQYYDLFKVLFY